MPDTREETLALLALTQVEGINHQLLRRLLCRFSPVQTALEVPDWNELSGGREFSRRPGGKIFVLAGVGGGPVCRAVLGQGASAKRRSWG